jgi:hypothetical protein
MTETRDLQSVIDAAEQAAAAGDYDAAEGFLREAARLQEAQLGPLHPDLANTLNNLGIVCEIGKNFSAAEHFFRRAYAIATASLPPDHPFVGTSRKNLEDFCKAQGRPIDLPPEPPAEPSVPTAPVSVPAIPKQDAPPVAPIETRAPARVESLEQSAEPPRKMPVLWIAAGVIAILAIGYLVLSLRSKPVIVPAPTNVVTTPSAPPPPVREPPRPVESAPIETPPKPAPRDAKKNATAAAPTLVEARLCRTLATGAGWRCVAPEQPVSPGPMYFYNRLKSSTDTSVEHRWYRGERLVHVANLRIGANPREGYRTYSRNTVTAQNAGEWRIELRTKDGTILHEERFVVR